MNFKSLFIAVLFCYATMNAFGQSATYNDVLTKKVKGKVNSYTTQNGEVFTVGDTITLGVALSNENYDYIEQNGGIKFFELSNKAANSRVVIKKMVAAFKILTVHTTSPQGYLYALNISNFEAAVQNGEVVSKLISSDQALEELKRWKDKLELGLITEQEYEEKKLELSPYIN